MSHTRFVRDGVEGVRFGRYQFGISSSCIVYRLGRTVIDTGPPNQWHAVRRFLAEREIDRALITHHHEDHSGNGSRVQSALGVEVFVPSSGRDIVQSGFPLRLYQRMVWGTPQCFQPAEAPPETAVGSGMRLSSVHTPGHSPDMTCYLEPERGWLFTGDLYITRRPLFLRADEDVDQLIESLRRTLRLEFDTVFCAHRGVVTDGDDAIRSKLDYLIELKESVRALRASGLSITEITGKLLGTESIMSYLTFFHFSKRNLVEACLGADA